MDGAVVRNGDDDFPVPPPASSGAWPHFCPSDTATWLWLVSITNKGALSNRVLR